MRASRRRRRERQDDKSSKSDKVNESPDLSAALRRRYREPVNAGAIISNPTLELLLAHRSVREFLNGPLPAGTVEVLTAAAQSAPTSSNTQSYSIVAVEDQDRKRRLASLADNQRFIEQAPLLLLWVADLARAHRVGVDAGEPLMALEYLEMHLTASLDAILAAQNAAIAASSIGLGSVFVGALRNDPEAVAAEIDLPPRSFVVAGLAVGFPNPDHAGDVKPRLPQGEVLHRETYRIPVHSETIARHDQHMRAFRREQGLFEAGWTEMLRARCRNIAALKGRDKLRTIMNRMGFALR
jgi:nitroreductase